MNDNSMSAGNHKTTFLEKHHRLDINQHNPTENQKVSLTSLNSPWTVLWLWYLWNKGVVSVVRYSKLGFYKLGLSGCYCHIINSRFAPPSGAVSPTQSRAWVHFQTAPERASYWEQRQMYKSRPAMFSHHVNLNMFINNGPIRWKSKAKLQLQ